MYVNILCQLINLGINLMCKFNVELAKLIA